MKPILNLLFLLLSIEGFAQSLKFEDKIVSIEVQESRTTYLFVKGILEARIDIGNNACISEAIELKKGYWLIKLRVVKPFDKTTLLLISESDIEIPLIELHYSKQGGAGKYVLDLTESFGSEFAKTGKSDGQGREELTKLTTLKTLPAKVESTEVPIENLHHSEHSSLRLPGRTQSDNEAFPARYGEGETFLAGRVSSSYHLRVFNLIREGNDLILAIELRNKLATELRIDDYQVQIEKKVKNRIVLTEVKAKQISLRKILGNYSERLFIRMPFFQLSEFESLLVVLKEETEFGMGREISIEIPYSSFLKIHEIRTE
jgi:hypothetical protein